MWSFLYIFKGQIREIISSGDYEGSISNKFMYERQQSGGLLNIDKVGFVSIIERFCDPHTSLAIQGYVRVIVTWC